jgi:tRNA dimethylallyltransferase
LSKKSSRPLIVVIGPTGTGKSHLAVHLAREFRGEIVNCDSVQVYRGLDIGSAKPRPADRLLVPHHLFDIIGPREELTAGTYARMARQVLQEVSERGAVPVVAGGTGFYLCALLDGLSPAPPRDAAIRRRLESLAKHRPAALFRYLRRFDPSAAERIHQNDRQKLIRAIELTMSAGRPASAVQSAARDALFGYRVLKLGLAPNRAALYEILNRRSVEMFHSGLLEETERLLACGVPPNAKALGSLGYKQAVQVLTAGLPLESAIEDLKTRTRQYARRQMTWFRREADVQWLEGLGTSWEILARAVAITRRFLYATPD